MQHAAIAAVGGAQGNGAGLVSNTADRHSVRSADRSMYSGDSNWDTGEEDERATAASHMMEHHHRHYLHNSNHLHHAHFQSNNQDNE